MKEQPTGDTAEVEALLEALSGEPDLGNRIERISAELLDRPYVENPLGGGPELPEALTVSLDGFDCVTYIETVLALALSESRSEFVTTIREIRYERGQISWATRNHYMIDWAGNNERRGFIINLTAGSDTVRRTRTLDVVKGFPRKTVSFQSFPKRSFARIAGQIATGDLILFVSVKKNLDVFHTGFLIRRRDEILLRHATRTKGAVIEQPLKDFLKSHRMSGFILLMPVAKSTDKRPL